MKRYAKQQAQARTRRRLTAQQRFQLKLAAKIPTTYGHFVLCLMAGLVLFSTSRVIFKSHVPMEGLGFPLRHYWMMEDYEPFAVSHGQPQIA